MVESHRDRGEVDGMSNPYIHTMYDTACGDLDRDQISSSFNFAYDCVVDEINQGMDP